MTFRDGTAMHVGYSRLAQFMKCGKQYEYTYVHGIRTEGGLPQRRGNAYHAAVETMLQYRLDNNDEFYSLKRAEKLAIRCAKAERLPEGETYKIIDAVRFYHQEVYPKHSPLGVEVPFEIIRGGVSITGRIDLIETTGNIVDHKYSYDTWAMSRAQYGVQPIIYQWAAIDAYSKLYKNWEYTGFSYNIIRLYPQPLVQVLEIPRMSQDQSDWWEEQVHAAALAIRRGYFWANPTESNCKFCDHRALCNPTIYRINESTVGGVIFDTDDY